MKKNKIVYSLVLILFVFLSLITASVAWFANFIVAENETDFFGSSIAAYFADGDGTKEDPYIISNANHLYNLAWLQNKNQFDSRKFYFKVCEIVGEGENIQHVPTTIDMAGKIFGADEEGRSGAIPPIGTFENPFEGYFDGFGSTISNLWVSTVKSDWKEQPEGVEEYDSKYVGLFGAIAGEAIIEDFVLDRVEVKSHIPDAKIGIICGYVNAMVKNVGVYNGILNVSAGTGVKSDYSLIGEKNARIFWDDMPTVDSEYEEIPDGGNDAGGAIKIDVNEEGFPQLGSAYTPVPQSAIDRAFIVGTSVGTAGAKLSNTNYIYSDTINSRNGAGQTFGTNGSVGDLDDGTKHNYERFSANEYITTSTVLQNYGIEINDDFKARIPTSKNQRVQIINTGTQAPQWNSPTTPNVTLSKDYDGDGQLDEIAIPNNSIWFKPLAPGNCVISFMVVNMSGNSDKYRSIYRFKRDNDGNIMEETWTETRFTFLNSKFGNSDLVVFQYYIDPLDVSEQYEFVIGAPTGISDSSIAFYFLALAGASNTGGGEEGTVSRPTNPGEFAEIMYDVDYVIAPNTNVSADTYVNHQTLLRIDTVAVGSKIYYLAAGTGVNTESAPNNSRVYYVEPANSEIIDISSGKQSDAVGKSDTFAGTTFKERDETRL